MDARYTEGTNCYVFVVQRLVWYNFFPPVKSGCYNEHGGVLSANVARMCT